MNQATPSIVIVHGHDLGRHIGPYGRGAPTPAVDAFARTALCFDRAFAPAPQCSPSRASLTTGKVPSKSGMMGLAHLGWSLRDPADALPHRLRALGYQTLLAGEQHEAEDPATLGYEMTVATEWPQRADRVAPAFAAALAGLDPARPFFASVGFFEAHRPFDHPGYQDDDPAAVTVPPYLPDTPEVRADIAAFHGRVRAFDEGFAHVLAALDQHGRADRTIVVVTTDHGIAFPRAKGTLFDPGLEIGLLVRWPGVTSPGERSDALVLNMDLYPTLLAAAGGTPPDDVDGIDLRALVAGAADGVRDRFHAQVHWHDAFVPLRAVRTETHKLILDFSGRDVIYYPSDVEESLSGRAARARPTDASARPEPAENRADESQATSEVAATAPRVALYDLVRDPHERTDISRDPAAAELVAELRAELMDWMRRTRDPIVQEEP